MLVRGLTTVAMMLVLIRGATADEKPGLLRRVSCSVVRYYVGRYSEAAAETWARSHGATDTDIEAARRCLGNLTVQPAGLTAAGSR